MPPTSIVAFRTALVPESLLEVLFKTHVGAESPILFMLTTPDTLKLASPTFASASGVPIARDSLTSPYMLTSPATVIFFIKVLFL